MKWIAIVLALVLAYALGSHNAKKSTPQPVPAPGIESEFEHISQSDLRDYQQLKDERARYDKANEILATIVQLFLADLGLQRKAKCSLEPGEFPPPPFAPAQAPPESRKIEKQEVKKEAGPITDEKGKGISRALYLAILWRPPDIKEEKSATPQKYDSHFYSEAQTLIRGKEFLQQVEPNHTAQQIINRMHTVFSGRCAFQNEMKEELESLSNHGPGRVVTDLLRSTLQKHREQLMVGGFPPVACETP